MKGLFYAIIGLILLVVLGMAWLSLRTPAGQQAVARALGKQSATDTAQSSQLPPQLAKKQIRRALGRSANSPVPTSRSETVGQVAVANSAAVDTQSDTARLLTVTGRFPSSQEIHVGTRRSLLLSEYGKPSVTITSSDSGHLRERFVYVDAPTGSRTQVFLMDGKVTDVETVSQ